MKFHHILLAFSHIKATTLDIFSVLRLWRYIYQDRSIKHLLLNILLSLIYNFKFQTCMEALGAVFVCFLTLQNIQGRGVVQLSLVRTRWCEGKQIPLPISVYFSSNWPAAAYRTQDRKLYRGNELSLSQQNGGERRVNEKREKCKQIKNDISD